MKLMLKNALLALLNGGIRVAAIFMLPRKKVTPLPRDIKRILVYGQMGIGNMIMFTPFLKALRDYFPDARIRLLLLKKNGAEQVIMGSGLVSEIDIWDYQSMGYRERLKAIRKTAGWRPDLIVKRFSSQPVDIALVMLLSRATYRLGHITSGGWQGKSDYLFNYPVKMADDEHEIDRDLRLAGEVGIPVASRKTIFYIGEESERTAREFLRAHGISNDEPFVTLQIGTSAAQSWKRWDMARWAKLADSLLQNGVNLVAVGSPDEKNLIEKTFAGLAVTNAAGELSLKQTAALIKASCLLVCNDSGLMHVAAAVGTPLVAIMGPSHYTRTSPPGKESVIIRKTLECSPCVTMKGTAQVEACRDRVCLKLISVEEVLEVVKQQLGKTTGAAQTP
jgi:ADP-heptose:LPS heptosyltransferase